jgi:uncharacterized protein (TIRG00374 family)
VTTRRLIVIACVIVGLAALVALAGDVHAVAGHLARYDLRYLLAGVALTSLNYGVRFSRWQWYLRMLDVAVPTRDSARIFVAGFVMSISPGKMGEVLKSALLAEQHGISVPRTAPIVLAERLTDLLALILIVAIAGASQPDGLVIAALGSLLVAAVLLPLLSRTIASLLFDVCARIPRAARLVPKLRDAYESTRTLLGGRALLVGTGIALAGWSLECVATFVIVQGFDGASLTPMSAAFGYAAPTIVGALSMLPGGLVATEATMASLFTRLGTNITPGIASGTTLLVRLATLWWGVSLGWIALALHERAVAFSKGEAGTT